ncbi:MAG: type II secretion system F family protein [Synergistales bacterium]|nr:type II secretion system F family protein [Synergistales bacterium]
MNFQYKARGNDGSIKSGYFETQSQGQVVAWLRSQGYVPISISQAREGSSESLLERMQKISTVKLKDKAVFFRQLATMIAAGITLASSLQILSTQTKNKRFADAVQHTKTLVDRGFPFSAAMRTRKEFDSLMISMVRAGEEGGVLDVTLERLATFLERQDELRKKIVSAVTYPAVVMSFALFVLYLLITVVVPRFKLVFEDLSVQMPWATRMLFSGSIWLQKHWYVTLMVIIGIGVSIFLAGKFEETKKYLDRIKLRMPILGDIFHKAIMSRSLRTLATLVEAGVPILPSLEMTASVSNNYVARTGFEYLRTAARRGHSLGASSMELKIFPAMVSHMITVGEETGHLEEMLNKVADWFEIELDERIKRLTSILEPVLILFVGGVVALVVFAVFTPIISAIQALL